MQVETNLSTLFLPTGRCVDAQTATVKIAIAKSIHKNSLYFESILMSSQKPGHVTTMNLT